MTAIPQTRSRRMHSWPACPLSAFGATTACARNVPLRTPGSRARQDRTSSRKVAPSARQDRVQDGRRLESPAEAGRASTDPACPMVTSMTRSTRGRSTFNPSRTPVCPRWLKISAGSCCSAKHTAPTAPSSLDGTSTPGPRPGVQRSPHPGRGRGRFRRASQFQPGGRVARKRNRCRWT
jgi:hypothetical protein